MCIGFFWSILGHALPRKECCITYFQHARPVTFSSRVSLSALAAAAIGDNCWKFLCGPVPECTGGRYLEAVGSKGRQRRRARLPASRVSKTWISTTYLPTYLDSMASETAKNAACEMARPSTIFRAIAISRKNIRSEYSRLSLHKRTSN